MGVSGKIAALFQRNPLTPLLALLALLLGLFAVWVTPREEEPQINVTMANVLVPFPGASVSDVEALVATPAEQVLAQIAGVEHVYSVAQPGLAVLTVQYKVGVPRTDALVRLYDAVHSNRDWLPAQLGVGEPIIKPKGIDDVPVLSLTLWTADSERGSYDLERVAHAMEIELKRAPGSREVTTLGGPGRAVRIELDAERMLAAGVTVADLRRALLAGNSSLPAGERVLDNRSVLVETGQLFRDSRELADLVVGVGNGRPVHLAEVATLHDGPNQPGRYAWHGLAGKTPREYPAVTITVTKKPGENAVQVTDALLQRVEQLRNSVIPAGVELSISRNYGATASDKAHKLIQKLLFATLSVVALVWLTLGRREAGIVGIAVALTLAATLFASWAWGFTLNRVSLFALIFSIGILVDDAIVVVENIHRHRQLQPDQPLWRIVPAAVDEVGGPTILATLTVIAALLPMAFVSGLMGPYMSPIPINASLGMLLSLAIAFVLTPWLAGKWLDKPQGNAGHGVESGRLAALFGRVFRPFLAEAGGRQARRKLWLGVLLLIVLSLGLAGVKLVVLKMLPFDNKSEFQVVVDMPAGTPLENTAAVLREMGAYLATVPEVRDYQAYVGAAAPINFNGLVRQYYLRSGAEQGDLQVNLLDKQQRRRQSHLIASGVRPALQQIAQRHGGRVKVVEVPPGPPVMAPLVAEVYGPDAASRRAAVAQVKAAFQATTDIVDIDDSEIASAPRQQLRVLQSKAASLGVSQQDIVATLRAGLSGEAVSILRDGQAKYGVPLLLTLPASQQSQLDNLLKLGVRSGSGAVVPLAELLQVQNTQREQPAYHKDLLPVSYVVADMVGQLDSPLYGLFAIGSRLQTRMPQLAQYFIRQPADPYRQLALKWDGEWQVTYETFRDMGLAYAVGLVLIYLLVVAQFHSYLTPLIIMAPIPLTLIGVLPGHALLGAQFTATSMIGMIALAGIIVRNSILLVDFIQLQQAQGAPLRDAVLASAVTRAKPIVLTGLAAMLGALFILDDPIFNGLAISLIFGILVSTMLTLLVIPLLYYSAYREAR